MSVIKNFRELTLSLLKFLLWWSISRKYLGQSISKEKFSPWEFTNKLSKFRSLWRSLFPGKTKIRIVTENFQDKFWRLLRHIPNIYHSLYTPCPSASVRCASVASPVDKFAEITPPVPNYSPLANKWIGSLPWS